MQTLVLEEHTIYEKAVLQTLSAFAGLMEDKNRHRESMFNLCESIRRTSGLNPLPVRPPTSKSSVDSLVKMYKLLKDTGALNKLVVT
jgi:hypothetical protein